MSTLISLILEKWVPKLPERTRGVNLSLFLLHTHTHHFHFWFQTNLFWHTVTSRAPVQSGTTWSECGKAKCQWL